MEIRYNEINSQIYGKLYINLKRVNKMQNEYYVIDIISNNIHVLLSLDGVTKVISRKDIQQSTEDKVIYQDREFFAYSLSELLNRDNSYLEDYALVIQTEDIEAILYIERIKEIRQVDKETYLLPSYLNRDYMIECYKTKDECLAFQVDFLKLLKRYYNLLDKKV